jgi:SAM-dependent methyltransferase
VPEDELDKELIARVGEAETIRISRRTSFDQVAELYDRARPVYPDSVFDDLVVLAGLPEGGRILEIGCGTGQATLPLVERGFEIVCVELGERLAAVARRKLIAFPQVEIVNAAFETWEPVRAEFDGVVAFTAFHWIDPDVRYAKSARLLAPNGALAVVGTKHVLPAGGDEFWVEVQADYDAVVPSDQNLLSDRRPPPRPDEVADLFHEFEAAGFRGVAVRRHLWDVTYGADEYLALLDTYSANRVLDPGTRRCLYERIHARSSAEPGGNVRKTYLATLTVGLRP